jgi:signal transduction histidine kinase
MVRLLRVAGLLAWLMVGVPVALQGVGRPDAFWVWLSCYVAFGALYAWTTVAEASSRARTAALLAEAGCVIAMAARQHRGLEGTLLVLVAMQLGLTTGRRVGLWWIVLQSLGLTWAIQHHWSLRSALLLGPPYLGFQVLAFLVLEVVGRETRGRLELARANAELVSTRELLAESARLNERLRIARELHDAMGHHLAGLSLNLEVLAQGPAPPAAALQTARTLVRRLLDDVESVVTALGGERGLDLGQALRALAAAIPRPVVHVDAPGIVLEDPERAHALLRCCQEIVTNAVKHAEAGNLWISLRVVDGAVQLTARDDGAGAARLEPGQGLHGMRRRLEEAGGALDLQTSPGMGFHVRATLPVGPAARLPSDTAA